MIYNLTIIIKNNTIKKMKKLVLTATLLASLGLVTVSCKDKTKSDPAPSKTPKELLTSGSWIPTKATFMGTEFPIADCDKDNFVTFKTDGTEVTDEGAVK